MANWETDHNNFAGLRIPGVYAGPNAGGFQSFDTPEAGLGAISRQLDRYASGATTGKPLTTLRSMISTWAPPSDNNPTDALIQRAAKVTGFDPDAVLNVGDPTTKAALIEAFIRNEQGGALPVDRGLITKVASSQPSLDVGKNKNMYPAFGNARSASALMPKSADPNVIDVGGGSDPTVSPVLASALAASGAGGATPGDPTAALMQLLKGNGGGLGYNPSKLLANMASGFLGGKGPAASLAGGFGGLAKSQEEDQSSLMKLAQMSMIYGPVLQQKVLQQKQSHAAQLARSGTPLGDAYKMAGLPAEDGETYDSMNDKSRSAMPLPPTSQKAVNEGLSNLTTQLQNQNVLTQLRDQVKNGEFHLDPWHRRAYEANNAFGMHLPWVDNTETQKYIAMTQVLRNMQGDLMNTQKGAASDKRAEMALEQLTGAGGGLQSNKQAENHFNYLTNHAGLAANRLRKQVENAYTLSKQKMPANFWESQNLPGAPLDTSDPSALAKNMYEDNTGSAATPTGGGLKTTPSGVKYQIINP